MKFSNEDREPDTLANGADRIDALRECLRVSLTLQSRVSVFLVKTQGVLELLRVLESVFAKARRIAETIPICIDWLTHGDNDVRARAESRLIDWTGQSFQHTWKGYHYQRPTLAEGQSMQRLWRAWWRENSSSFKPRKPCSFPCENTEKAPQ